VLPGGSVRQPCSYSVPSPIDCLKIPFPVQATVHRAGGIDSMGSIPVLEFYNILWGASEFLEEAMLGHRQGKK
jgi:hypothetical protein